MRFKFLLLVLLAPLITAQSVQLSRTTISGYVRSPHGAPAANATVIARSNAERQLTHTDKNGHYIFFSLPGGAYAVYASARHAHACAPRHLEVQVGFRYDVDLVMHRHCD